ncbi:MAG: (d)CMP kinase [Actinomycetota bacterium]|nr:(d)CMP kinase [Actinomycetota bacterium]
MTVVAIDGPAGAGKSTVARAVAGVLGFDYLDTGAMYRAVALGALEREISPADSDALVSLAESIQIQLRGEQVILDGRDVSAAIRKDEVTAMVSRIAAVPGVRRAMATTQRRIAESSDVVMEGRDIGSEVVPNAEVKIFLTASIRERARRRAEQLGRATDEEAIEDLVRSIEARDRADASRSDSPLVKADDAVLIDSTSTGVEEVVEEIARVAGEVLHDH